MQAHVWWDFTWIYKCVPFRRQWKDISVSSWWANFHKSRHSHNNALKIKETRKRQSVIGNYKIAKNNKKRAKKKKARARKKNMRANKARGGGGYRRDEYLVGFIERFTRLCTLRKGGGGPKEQICSRTGRRRLHRCHFQQWTVTQVIINQLIYDKM